jgi:predicted DNA-binding transcriptional regulator AlpA
MTAPGWPRMMKRATAARYCDLSSAEFEREVACGRLPMPVKLGNSEHWDRVAIDEDLNRIAGHIKDWRDEQPGLAA